ncbi:anaerobic sulfatase maturase [Lachnoanaerobaculum saburreum F0468]|uniref:Anaerobic sulfatase maturase n=1 Tax=Lachnoanaerobaculum saburreum F0468 TaxID=1095750 RepID=I0RAP9_9FIRM|nr:anaerobic sulfatase maturase [Lachnoanaerobaculum saburreum]EIC96757.1 anaerobic sulfatase maturase [Lachnoanaerobaculum saburreum F0468]
MPPITVLIKPASSLCNMSCEYCFYCDEANKRTHDSYGFMSEKTLKNTIRKTMLRAEGSIHYAFQGGEPTLCGIDFFKKALAYQRRYNKNNVEVSNALQTNGFTLTDEWCSFFKENNFLIGLSVDGTEKIHNSYRHTKSGDSTFERVINSAKLLDKYKVDYNILTVVTSDVARNISDIYHFYKKQGWKYQQYIACLDPIDEERGTKSYSLTSEIYGEFLIKLFDLWDKDYKKGKDPYNRQFINYINLAGGYMAESCEQNGVCGIQTVVEADGSVYPCDFYAMDEYRLGNFNENNMSEIDEKRFEIGFVEKSFKLDSGCRECKYYRVCRGGCQRNRDFNQDSGLYSNYFCKAYKIFFDACYDRILEIAKSLS